MCTFGNSKVYNRICKKFDRKNEKFDLLLNFDSKS